MPVFTKQFSLLAVFLVFFTSCQNSPALRGSGEVYIWSHNDYEQPRPLADALEQGAQMIEADIHLVDGRIYVAHDPPDTSITPVLEELYLDPLAEILSARDDVLPESDLAFWLVIDVKTEAGPTFEALTDALAPYRHLFTRKEDGEWIEAPLHLLISGNRPELSANSPDRIAFIDGRIPDLGKGFSSELYPAISDNWQNFFTWDGTGEIPEQELEQLNTFVGQAHLEEKRIRFWATPDNEAVWEVLIRAGVDIINADDIEGMRNFLDQR